jgi:1-phosphofructokinase family hexose kinase
VILCVTPSPAIDRTARVARLTFGAILRPTEVVSLPGGKGNNVARAANRLGALVTTTGFAGGHAGRWMVEALEAEGLNPRFVTVAGETRTTYVTVDTAGRSTLVYEPTAPVGEADVDALLALLSTSLLPSASWVAVCGSPPAGMPADGYATLVEAAHAAARPCLVDTGGPALAAALAARPDVVKVSRDEAASVLAGDARDAVGAARALVAGGAALAIVTDGPRGAGAADGRMAWQVDVPRVRALDAIGSGDAFSAALLVALDAGRSTEEALASAAAAGTANAETVGAGRFDVERHAELTAGVRVSRRTR